VKESVKEYIRADVMGLLPDVAGDVDREAERSRANDRTSRRPLWTGVACSTLAWIYFSAVDMQSRELALYPNTLMWRGGASPVALLAYLSLYWFAVDPPAAD
jgi:hypothetical protein